MEIKKAVFLKSFDDCKKMKDDQFAEFAFIGRSNVGKSSLINMICNKKDLAKTSSMPGKTKLINQFFINDSIYFADLPGYGYARVSKTERSKFEELINNYIICRKNLYCLFILVDSRLEPQKSDIEFINKCGENRVPICLIFTKTDKDKGKFVNQNVQKMKDELRKYWENIPPLICTSALNGQGKIEILKFISDCFNK
ncbi:MAG: YihA family ribosome biogenesis GTP-binding protein [Bacteroidetes bacterium]|nr:YihA family ribosome biogenesis GTP-binding protein [Bacteroidota bacterium]